MPRDIPVGNGNILVAFDKNYLLREFYFPYVGEESHTKGELFRFGVWVNGRFSWVPEGWSIKKDYLKDTLITNVELENRDLNIRIYVNDLVDFQENIYIKKITVENLSDEAKDVRLFLCHDFHIYANDIGDTAAYRPEAKCLWHYKSMRHFLINIYANSKYGIDYFATGSKERKTGEGTFKDAEDGLLSANPIAQGAVDSVAGIYLKIGASKKETFFYWICAGTNFQEVFSLNKLVTEKTPEAILKRTADYWKLWADKEELNFDLLSPKLTNMFKRSLLIVRTQIDNRGAVTAGNDSDVIHFNRDTYSYVWMRDGALTSYALDLAGYNEISRNFFIFCAKVIEKEGYFLHKYSPQGALASSWHPWFEDNKVKLPIQEDSTALVIWALWNHYVLFRDIELIKQLYKPLIISAADFMLLYRDSKTKLPLPSYDLWEERKGISTFTTASVYGGLIAASNFSRIFGDTDISESYRTAAVQTREAMDKYLYLNEEKRFARMINFNKDSTVEIDKTIDSSLYGIFAFGAYPAYDDKVSSTMKQIYDALWCNTSVGGLARYENDNYHRQDKNITGNPWFITTMWLAQYYIARAATKTDLEKSLKLIEWAADRAFASGVLPEQLHPHTGEAVSVSPLTWSHSAFLIAVGEYLDKLLEIEKCTACSQSKFTKKRKQTA